MPSDTLYFGHVCLAAQSSSKSLVVCWSVGRSIYHVCEKVTLKYQMVTKTDVSSNLCDSSDGSDSSDSSDSCDNIDSSDSRNSSDSSD